MTNKVLKTVIIDDSGMQMKVISKLVKNHPKLSLVATYENGMVARKGIMGNTVDLILLDIEMPVINGFDFLDAMEKRPQIIIISGKTDYALRAFDYDVTDYLHKPIGLNRFNTAIERAVSYQLSLEMDQGPQEYIFVNSNLQKKKVVLGQIKWIEALGDYVKLVTDDGTVLVLSTMKAFIQRLPQNKFVRIHKSYTVNIERIDRFNSTSVEVAGIRIPLSRLRKNNLEQALSEI